MKGVLGNTYQPMCRHSMYRKWSGESQARLSWHPASFSLSCAQILSCCKFAHRMAAERGVRHASWRSRGILPNCCSWKMAYWYVPALRGWICMSWQVGMAQAKLGRGPCLSIRVKQADIATCRLCRRIVFEWCTPRVRLITFRRAPIGSLELR